MKPSQIDVLVLDSSLRQTLVCVRSLGRRGLQVAAGGSRRSAAGASRWCRVETRIPPVGDDGPGFVEAVTAAVERLQPRVVIASHDGSVSALQAFEGTIGATLALGDPAAVRTAESKAETYALADRLGIRRPRSVAVRSQSEVADACAELRPPVVVKPERSWATLGVAGTRLSASIAVSRAEAERAVTAIVAAGGEALLQEWIGGRREAISFLRQGGAVRMRFAQVAYRMTPPLGGSSVVRESVDLPQDAAEDAESLVAAMQLDGYSEVEFRRDPEGRPVLMEVNPRLSASVEVAVRAGIDFPAGMYSWANDETVPLALEFKAGVRMRWLGGDMRWLWHTLRSQGKPDSPSAGRAAAAFVGEFFRRDAYDYVSVSDPVPTLVATQQFMTDAAALVGRRLAK